VPWDRPSSYAPSRIDRVAQNIRPAPRQRKGQRHSMKLAFGVEAAGAGGGVGAGDPCSRSGIGRRRNAGARGSRRIGAIMLDFSNASFSPEVIGIMKAALDAAVASLPGQVSSAHIHAIAETILRTAKEGERDPMVLQRTALMELQISTRR